jgi:hypothetical protein
MSSIAFGRHHEESAHADASFDTDSADLSPSDLFDGSKSRRKMSRGRQRFSGGSTVRSALGGTRSPDLDPSDIHWSVRKEELRKTGRLLAESSSYLRQTVTSHLEDTAEAHRTQVFRVQAELELREEKLKLEQENVGRMKAQLEMQQRELNTKRIEIVAQRQALEDSQKRIQDGEAGNAAVSHSLSVKEQVECLC